MFPRVSTEKVLKMARRVGRRVAAEYPGIDPEDISSEAVTRLAGKAHRLKDPSPDYVYRVLERDAVKYASEVRYDYVINTSQYIYTPREVRALLAHAYFNPECWDVPHGRDDRLSAEIDARSLGISLMDLKEAMGRIRPEHQQVLETRFGLGEDVHRQRVQRAVEALTRAVNRLAAKRGRARGHEGPGARKAMLNDTAQYVTRAEMGHETNPHERDALRELERLRSHESAPAGTYFNWEKESK